MRYHKIYVRLGGRNLAETNKLAVVVKGEEGGRKGVEEIRTFYFY